MLPSFLTHYYEAERGPFKNICDLSEEEVDRLILAEKETQPLSGIDDHPKICSEIGNFVESLTEVSK
jgi:hypothetical protein